MRLLHAEEREAFDDILVTLARAAHGIARAFDIHAGRASVMSSIESAARDGAAARHGARELQRRFLLRHGSRHMMGTVIAQVAALTKHLRHLGLEFSAYRVGGARPSGIDRGEVSVATAAAAVAMAAARSVTELQHLLSLGLAFDDVALYTDRVSIFVSDCRSAEAAADDARLALVGRAGTARSPLTSSRASTEVSPEDVLLVMCWNDLLDDLASATGQSRRIAVAFGRALVLLEQDQGDHRHVAHEPWRDGSPEEPWRRGLSDDTPWRG